MKSVSCSDRVVAVLEYNNDYMLFDTKKCSHNIFNIQEGAQFIDFIKIGGMCGRRGADGKIYEITLDEAKDYIKEHFPDKYMGIFGKKKLNKSRKHREREARNDIKRF